MSKSRVRTTGIEYPTSGEQIDYFTLWQRNVLDKYKSVPDELVKEDLKKSASKCAVMMSQIEGDFNFSCVIRSSNNFNVSKVFYYGNRRFDKRGCQGTHHYTDVIFLSSIEDIINLKKDYKFVGLENNVDNVIPMKDFKWHENSLLILGEEGTGIPECVMKLLDYKVEIPSNGSVRSINVAAAASIALYDYTCKVR